MQLQVSKTNLLNYFWHWVSPLITHWQTRGWEFTFTSRRSCIWIRIHLILFIHLFHVGQTNLPRRCTNKTWERMNKLLHFSKGIKFFIRRTNLLSVNTKKLQSFTFTQRMQRKLACVHSPPKLRQKRPHMKKVFFITRLNTDGFWFLLEISDLVANSLTNTSKWYALLI